LSTVCSVTLAPRFEDMDLPITAYARDESVDTIFLHDSTLDIRFCKWLSRTGLLWASVTPLLSEFGQIVPEHMTDLRAGLGLGGQEGMSTVPSCILTDLRGILSCLDGVSTASDCASTLRWLCV
jgi:hypothetical protein